MKRVIFVGTRGSSKTTSLGLLALTCDIISTQDPNFSHFIDEKTSGIRQVPSDLCQGYFPEPTPPGLIYEADLYLKRSTRFGDKTVVLPFCETAGEDIQNLIGRYQKSVYHQSIDWQSADNLNKYICDSNGYVLVVPVSRAHVAGVPQMDEEPQALLQDPDVNISRILSAVWRYKLKSRSPHIEGIAVLLTKYDMVDAWLKSMGMDLYDDQGAKLFLDTYFRQTSGLLKHINIYDRVKFFPMHVQVERVKDPQTGIVSFAKWPDGRGYKIAVDEDRNLPIYAEQSCRDLINWIMERFAQ
jgi:hypothetical protein